MSWATLYVLLIPAIGYICLSKQNQIKRNAKPISGLELTYHSAIYGVSFLTLSFLLVKMLSFYLTLNAVSIDCALLSHVFRDLNEQVICFVSAAFLSFAWSLWIKVDDKKWEGDANTGRIWGELLAKESIVVIFLKNGKCYRGLLTQVEVSERVPVEDRVVSLFVLMSGFQNPKGTVDWNTSYSDPLKHHFFMCEISNFSEYARGATFTIKKGTKKSASPTSTGEESKSGDANEKL